MSEKKIEILIELIQVCESDIEQSQDSVKELLNMQKKHKFYIEKAEFKVDLEIRKIEEMRILITKYAKELKEIQKNGV